MTYSLSTTIWLGNKPSRPPHHRELTVPLPGNRLESRLCWLNSERTAHCKRQLCAVFREAETGDSPSMGPDSDSGKLWHNKGLLFEAVSSCVIPPTNHRRLLHFHSYFVIAYILVAFLESWSQIFTSSFLLIQALINMTDCKDDFLDNPFQFTLISSLSWSLLHSLNET